MKTKQTMNTQTTIKKFSVWCLSALLLCGMITPPSQAQTPTTQIQRSTQARGHVIRSFRQEPGDRTGRPLWAERAMRRSLSHLSERRMAPLRDPQSELTLRAAEQDDLGQTHVRMNQVQQGVEVFGGQLIAHLEADTVREVTGRVFDTTGSEPTATLPADQAIVLAKAALHYGGEFTVPPGAKLVMLPHRISKGDDQPGATLTWQVSLNVEDGTDATGSYQYFINAQDGQVVWHYNAMPQETTNIKQTGRSLYSGQVTINTQSEATPTQRFFGTGNYKLVDGLHGGPTTNEMSNGNAGNGSVFSVFFTALTSNYVWGNGTTSSRESAAVDAHFGLANVWDYFLNTFHRIGIDNGGTPVTNRVHFGTNWNNATYGNYTLNFGDGDGQLFSPLVSLDVIAHEFTHGVTEKTAGLIYAGESGALNESFSDVFGTGAEFYANIRPNYLIGEDVYTPATKGDALRNMADPTAQGQPDHYTKRAYPGPCTPTALNDNCGVHTNSGIMNKVFYLLSEGGTHPYSKVRVGKIERFRAEWIFYRALTHYLTSSARFVDARQATIRAAQDAQVQLEYGRWVAEEVAKAWDAVGVGDDVAAGAYVVRAKHSGSVLDVEGISGVNGAAVHQWGYWGGDNQKWQIESVGNGYYRLTARHSGKALDIRDANKGNGGILQQWDYAGGENQQFQIAPAGDGYYMIVARHSGRTLEVAGISMANGAQIIQWDYWGGDNQKWKLERIQ